MCSNPVHSYVKRWQVYASLGEYLGYLKKEGACYRRYRLFPGKVILEKEPVSFLELLTEMGCLSDKKEKERLVSVFWLLVFVQLFGKESTPGTRKGACLISGATDKEGGGS